MIELPEIPQPSQHGELRVWAERLVVALKQYLELAQEKLLSIDGGTMVGDLVLTTAPPLNDNTGRVVSSFWFQRELDSLSVSPVVKGTWPGYGFWDTDAAVGSKRALLKYADKEFVFIRLDDAGTIVDYPFSCLASGIFQMGYGGVSLGDFRIHGTCYSQRATGGSVRMTTDGGVDRTGWVEWRRQDGTRIGYMGYVIDGAHDLDYYWDVATGTQGHFNLGNCGLKSNWGVQCRQGVGGTTAANWYNIYWTGAAAQLWINNTNVGNISLVSDVAYKQNIRGFGGKGLELINALRPVLFRWKDEGIFKDDKRDHIGFIAQEVKAVIPRAVAGGEGDALSIDPLPMMAVMVKATQELSAKVELLVEKGQEAVLRIKGLEDKVTGLEGQVEALTARVVELETPPEPEPTPVPEPEPDV